MLEKYDEFKNKNKDINKKIGELRKQKYYWKWISSINRKQNYKKN